LSDDSVIGLPLEIDQGESGKFPGVSMEIPHKNFNDWFSAKLSSIEPD
jgi:hypothetical protein